MSNIIDKIQLSGVTYDIGGQGGSGVSVVEVTQAVYDELPSSAKTDTSKMYVITDAEAGDLTNYYTKTETNTLLGGKADTATTYTKTEVDNAITAATSTKQDTLVSGTNIKTINNISILGSGNIDIQGGGGGGKAIEAGRYITVTTGETADTVSFNLPIGRLTGNSENCVIFGYPYGTGSTTNNNSVSTNSYNDFIVGSYNKINVTGSGTFYSTSNTIFGNKNNLYTTKSISLRGYNVMMGNYNTLSGSSISNSFVVGEWNSGYTSNQLISGSYNIGKNYNETTLGRYNNSVSGSSTFGDSGNTLFSVGNGTADNARHNAFEIRQNGDIYYFDGTNDVKLQDKFSSIDTTIGDINTILQSI